MIEFTVYGEAAPAGSKTTGVRRDGTRYVRDSGESRKRKPKTSEWRAQIAQVAGERMAGRELLRGPVSLDVAIYMPRSKGHYGTGRNAGVLKPSAPVTHTKAPDITKLLRAIEDALTGIVWADDAQVVVQHATKGYGEPARVRVAIEDLTPALTVTDDELEL